MFKRFLLTLIAVLAFGGVFALGFLQIRVMQIQAAGIAVNVDGKSFVVNPDKVGFPANGWQAMRLMANFQPLYNPDQMRTAIQAIAKDSDVPLKDISVAIKGQDAELDTTTSPGSVLNQEQAYNQITSNLNMLRSSTSLHDQKSVPTVQLASAERALAQVRQILKNGITVQHGTDTVSVSPEQIGSWIETQPSGSELKVAFNHQKILDDLSKISAPYDQKPQDLDVQVQNGKVVSFQAPKDGVITNKEQAFSDITALLSDRESAFTGQENPVQLIDQTAPAGVTEQAKALGIKELIGSGTTTFDGSTKNRITNIQVGAARLNGILVAPSQEFSTIDNLGPVDGDHGFVPELVIKGPDTIPEFGGGLCQVSTTLFRAALNAGLPITERQNHSYRVSFYEKDGDGKYIGPGLDATIYEPHPDFRFANDTGNWIFLTSQIIGKKITFNIYGTRDGRIAKITGPTIIATYQPKDDPSLEVSGNVQPGSVKEVEFARTGAKTTATYQVTYPDGTVKTQVFNSYYHPVQAKFLVSPAAPTSAPAPAATTTAH